MKKPLYEKDTLKKGILKCKENIAIFQKAIEKEQSTIITYSTLIKEHELYEQSTNKGKASEKGKT